MEEGLLERDSNYHEKEEEYTLRNQQAHHLKGLEQRIVTRIESLRRSPGPWSQGQDAAGVRAREHGGIAIRTGMQQQRHPFGNERTSTPSRLCWTVIG